MNLNDYYLVKVFGKPEYMKDFNSGNIYLNSTSYFWELENTFQQDKEGLVFQQPYNKKGVFLSAKEGFEEIVKNSFSLEEIIKKSEEKNCDKVICETLNFSFRLEGYICCFYLLPKNDVTIKENRMFITSETAQKDIDVFLKKYLNEAKTKEIYVSIYNAVNFYNIFAENMKKRGYGLTYGIVKYKDIDERQKIELFQQNYKLILFTKPTQYSYQKEFRLFINTPNEQIKKHILLDKIDIHKSLLGSFCYANIRKKLISLLNLITLMSVYSFDRKIKESECMAELMKMYQKLIEQK